MLDQKILCEFLVKAKQATYAAGENAKKISNSDSSTTLIFEAGEWKYHDNYFGGEPFGGREVVFFQGKPVYLMVYYGKVSATVQDFSQVYGVLQGALSQITIEAPYRGPREYLQGDFVYRNNYQGTVESFSGEEIIWQEEKEIYRTKYVGGLVDIPKNLG